MLDITCFLFLFGWVFYSSYWIFLLIWRRHYWWGAAILTNDRPVWPLSSEDSWSWHTYYDTLKHPFIIVISVDPWHSQLLPSVWQLSLPIFTTKVCRGWDSNTQHFAYEANSLTHCATPAVLYVLDMFKHICFLKLCMCMLLLYVKYVLNICAYHMWNISCVILVNM